MPKILLKVILAFVFITFLSVLPSDQAFGQITNYRCNGCNPCEDGLNCYAFSALGGARCAKLDPCSYLKCPSNSICEITQQKMPEICPERKLGEVSRPPVVSCKCIGSDCSESSHTITATEFAIARESSRLIREVTNAPQDDFPPKEKSGTLEPIILEGISADISCSTDLDCTMINIERGFDCCSRNRCGSDDYAMDEFNAVNTHWFYKEKKLNCSSHLDCGPPMYCLVTVYNSHFQPVCINRKCQKLHEYEIDKLRRK